MFSFFFSFSLGTSTHFTTCHEKFGEEFSLNSSWGLLKSTQIIWLLENPALSCCWQSKCSVCLCYSNMTPPPPKNNPNLHELLHGSACVVDLLLTGNRTTIWKRCKIAGVYCSLCHKLDGQLYKLSYLQRLWKHESCFSLLQKSSFGFLPLLILIIKNKTCHVVKTGTTVT